jgi:hypothetical protein
MKKLADFVTFLTELDLVAAEKINPYVDSVQLLPSGKIKGATLSADSCVVCRQKYTALIDIENYPHSVHPPALLFSHISAWLIDNDTDRYDLENPQPKVIVDVTDNAVADVLIEIEFAEEVILIRDDAGTVDLAGKKWALSSEL